MALRYARSGFPPPQAGGGPPRAAAPKTDLRVGEWFNGLFTITCDFAARDFAHRGGRAASAQVQTMAKASPAAGGNNRPGFFSNFFFIVMSVMALNTLAVGVILALLLGTGRITKNDLYDIAQVLVGNHKYVLSKAQIIEYDNLKKEKAEAERQLAEVQGTRATREAGARDSMDMKKELEERIRALKDLRQQHENTLVALREQIETARKDYIKEQQKLKDWKKEVTKTELSENFQKNKKILLAMDPQQIANYFLQILPSAGTPEIARIVHQYLTPEITAEVLAGIPDRELKKILPALEDRYADMTPAAIVRAWTTPGTDNYKTVEQMAALLKHMTATRAFTIFTLLDPKIRAALVQYLITPDGDEKPNE